MYSLKLETAHLRDDDRILSRILHNACIRISDISNYKDALFPVFHNLSEKRCRRCLSVRSCNSEDISFSARIGKLYLSPDRNSFFFHFLNYRKVRRNSRAHHGQIQFIEYLLRKCSDYNLYIFRHLFLDLHRIQLFVSIIEDHVRAFSVKQNRCGFPADTGTKYKYLLFF